MDICIYTHTHAHMCPKNINLYCLLLVVFFFCLWKGGKELREFVAKEGKFRDSFHFKVEM